MKTKHNKRFLPLPLTSKPHKVSIRIYSKSYSTRHCYSLLSSWPFFSLHTLMSISYPHNTYTWSLLSLSLSYTVNSIIQRVGSFTTYLRIHPHHHHSFHHPQYIICSLPSPHCKHHTASLAPIPVLHSPK